MKKKLRKISLILLFFVVAGMSVQYTADFNEKNVNAETETNKTLQGECGDNLKWVLKDNILTISGTGEIPESFVDDMMDEYEDFSSEDVKKIKIEKGITKIGKEAFCFCDSLEEVELPDGIKVIGEEAFQECNELKKINLPEGLEKIEASAFSGDASLKEVQIPESVLDIETSAFNGCAGITSIKLPKQLTTLNSYTFSACTSLKKIDLPDGLKKIGDRAFNCCDSLEEITIPETVNEIGKGAFSGCDTIKYIEIPDSVTELGREAFAGCEKLEYVKLSKNLKALRERTFSRCPAITSIEVPSGVETLERQAIVTCRALKYVIIPQSVTTMEYDCMGYRTGKAVIVGESSSEAEKYAKNNGIKFISFDNWQCDHEYKYEVLEQATLKEDGLEIDRCENCGKTILAKISHPVSLRIKNASNPYNGGAIRPEVEIKLANGKILEEQYYQYPDADDHIYPGSYKVQVTLQDKYNGAMEGTYKITKADRVLTYYGEKEIIRSYDQPFDLNIRANGERSKIIYKVSDSKILTVDTTGKIRAKCIGTSTITAYVNENDHYNRSNVIKVKVKIIPAKVKVKSIKATAGRRIAIKWSKDTKVDGFYINYSTKKNMLGAKSIKIKNNKTTSVTLKNLKSKKKYYIEIYGYKKMKSGKSYKETIGGITKKAIKTK